MPKMQVAESIEIAADPQTVFQLVSDFNRWTQWSPWLCCEPDAKVTVTNDANSVGSIYQWEGELVGQGEIEHLVLDPGSFIEQDLRFVKPWKSQATVTFDFQPSEDGTKVTWTMDSKLPFFMFWMKSTMEAMIGMDYERGLKMMKELIETGKVESTTTIRGVESVGPLHVAGYRQTCTMNDIGPALSDAISKTMDTLNQKGISAEPEKIAVYHGFDMKNRTFDVTSGTLVCDPLEASDGLETWSLPKTQALAVEHRGSYDNLGNPWGAAYQYVRYKKLKQKKCATFEIYRNDPADTATADLQTDIYLPLK